MIPLGAQASVAASSDMNAKKGLCAIVCDIDARARELIARGMVTCHRLSPVVHHMTKTSEVWCLKDTLLPCDIPALLCACTQNMLACCMYFVTLIHTHRHRDTRTHTHLQVRARTHTHTHTHTQTHMHAQTHSSRLLSALVHAH